VQFRQLSSGRKSSEAAFYGQIRDIEVIGMGFAFDSAVAKRHFPASKGCPMNSLRTTALTFGILSVLGLSTSVFAQPRLLPTQPSFAPGEVPPGTRLDLRTASRDLDLATHHLSEHMAAGQHCEESMQGIEHLEELVHNFRTAVSRNTHPQRLQSSLKHIVIDFRDLIGHLREDGVSRAIQQDILAVRDRLNVAARFLGITLQYGHDCDFHDHHDDYDVGYGRGGYGRGGYGRGGFGDDYDFPTRSPRYSEPVVVPAQPVVVPPVYTAPRNTIGLKLGKVQIHFQSR
jgi:hypothetical protein